MSRLTHTLALTDLGVRGGGRGGGFRSSVIRTVQPARWQILTWLLRNTSSDYGHVMIIGYLESCSGLVTYSCFSGLPVTAVYYY